MTNTKKQVQELDQAKSDYKLLTTVNHAGAEAARLASNPYHVVDLGISAAEQHFENQASQTLYAFVTKDSYQYERAALESGRLNTSNAFKYLSERLVDQELPVDMRLQYVRALSSATVNYYDGIAQQVDNFQNSVDSLSVVQQEQFNMMRMSSEEMSSRLKALHSDFSEFTEDQFHEFRNELQSDLKQVANSLSNCVSNLGELRLDQNKLLNQQDGMTHKLFKLQEVTGFLFQVQTNTNIKGFEQDKELRDLYSELQANQKLQQSGVDVNKQLAQLSQAIKSRKAVVVAERENLTDSLKTTQQAVNGLSTLVSLFGEDKLAHQLQTVGSSTVSVVENVCGMMGMLTTSVNPVMAAINVAGAVMNVVKLFQRGNKGANPHEMLMKAIQQLSELVSQMRKEMHHRFDEVLSVLHEQHAETLLHFAAVHGSHYEMAQQLHLLYVKLNLGFSEQAERLNSMGASLKRIENLLTMAPFNQDVDKLKEVLNLLHNHQVSDYKATANLIDTLGLTYSLDHQLTQVLDLADPLSPVQYFQVTDVLAKRVAELANTPWSHLPNPALTAYSCQAALVLNLKEYPVGGEQEGVRDRDRISKTDLQRLDAYKKTFGGMSELVVLSRSQTVLEKLFSAYRNSTEALASALELKVAQVEQSLTEDRKERLRGMQLELLHRMEQNYNRAIEPGSYGWFVGTSQRHQRNYNNRKWRCYPHQPEVYTHERRQQYLQERTHAMNVTRGNSDQSSRQNRNDFFRYELHAFEQPTVPDTLGVRFVEPLDPQLPVLTAPRTLAFEDNPAFTALMRNLQLAQMYGLGFVHLCYDVDTNNLKFHLRVRFHTSNHHLDMVMLTFDFDPLFYNLPEAVCFFWYGGNMVTQLAGVPVSHRTGNTSFGHKDRKSRREHDYTDYNYTFPQPSVMVRGKLDEFELHQVPEPVLHLSQEEVLQLASLLETETDVFKQETARVLQLSLSLNGATPELHAPLVAFETDYRYLFGTLGFAFHNTMSNPDSMMRLWFKDHVSCLSNLLTALNLEHVQSPVQLLRQLSDNLELLKHNVSHRNRLLGSAAAGTENLDFHLLTTTLLELELFLFHYKNHAVETNKNQVSSSGRDQMAEALFETLVGQTRVLVNALGTANSQPLLMAGLTELQHRVSGFDEGLRQEFVTRLSEHFLQSGFRLEWHDRVPTLTMFSSEEREPSFGTRSRFFGRSEEKPEDLSSNHHQSP